jgi:amino acid permease
LNKTKLIDRQLLLAEGTLIGTAIGAGTFGLPYITAKAGFFPVMGIFLVLGILTVYSNLMYGEISLRTKNNCRLTGYAGKYLGEGGRKFAALMTFLSLYASVLVYIILGGIFLNTLLSPLLGGNDFIYGIIIFIFASLCSYFNLNLFATIESWMVVIMLAAMAVIVGKATPHINLVNFTTSDISQFFFPFGAILFSLSASLAIPDFEHIIKKRQGRIKGAILWGTIIYILLYVVFIIAVLGVTGGQTSEEAFAGLKAVIGDGIIIFGIIFGLLAVLTSYLVTAISLKEIFQYDYKLSENKAWFWSSSVPFVIFVLGLRDFIKVITIAGSVMGGFIGILIILIFYRAQQKGDMKPAYKIKVSEGISALMILVYLLGIIYEFVYPSW